MRRARRAAVLGLALAAGALMLFAAAGAAAEATWVETRVTTDPANQYDPAISGDVVVFTGDTGTLGTDIFAFGVSTGAQTQVTSASGKQQLSDVDGRLVACTDFAPPIVDGVRSGSDVVVYALDTNLSLDLTADSLAAASNPAIGLTAHGHPLVAWEDRRDGDSEVYGQDLATGERRRITDYVGEDTNLAVADGRIAWEQRDGPQRDIEVYDWAAQTTTQVTATSEDESTPDIDGDTVVYQAVRDGEQDVFATDLVTGVETRLELPGLQQNPSVSGRLVSFEDLSSGVSHVYVWDLSSGAVRHVTGGASAQFLNDVDGNRVVYTDDRDGQQDIYLTELALPGEGVAPRITSDAGLGFTVGAAGSATITATGDPTPALTLTGALPAGLEFRDDRDGTATISGTPALATGGVYAPTVTASNGVEPDARQTLTLTVSYVYHGFFQPIDDGDVLNTTSAGRAIPVKFDLNGSQGLAVLAAGYPRSAQIPCEPGEAQDTIEQTVTASSSGLTFDATADAPLGQYVYVWKTDKGWTGQCRRLEVRFVDGQTRTADFRFTR